MITSRDIECIVLELAASTSAIPKLCALVVFSPFDIAAFDAWGKAHHANTFVLLRESTEAQPLAPWLDDGFRDFGLNQVLTPTPRQSLALFHSVGGLDALTMAEVTRPVGDGLPECLEEWIDKDELTHLKIKLRGDDPVWDFQRVVNVDRIASVKVRGEPMYSLDFNERCASGVSLLELLLRLQCEAPAPLRARSDLSRPGLPRFSVPGGLVGCGGH